ncbi:hypothetical protein LSAT2_021668 [Lamellibrachia satsuma]|nr:hypothetical protein LSAT2_021668 [Lamellibrachia satsuma]
MPDDESRTNCHICEAHFTGESYKPGEELKVRMKHKKNKSLEEHAVPTINPPDPRKMREKRKDDGESSNECRPSKTKRTGSAASKLVVARLLEEHTVFPHIPEVAQQVQDLPAPSCDAIVTSEATTSATKGTQCTQKKCVYVKSEKSQTDRFMMTDAATQYSLSDFCVTHSTPVKGVAPPLPAPPLALTEDNYETQVNLPHPSSPLPSPFPSPDKGSEYKPSELSCSEAAEDEDVSTDEENVAPKLSEKDQRKFLFFEQQLLELFRSCLVNEWTASQNQVLDELREIGGGLELSGDGRYDSPGHSAKYGGYTLMENRVNKVLDIQLVQSNEVGSSNACELEGLRRGIEYLTNSCGMQLDCIITDRHKQINAYLRDQLHDNPLAANMKHYYDVWHVAKGLGNKVDAVSKRSGCQHVALWRKSIVNHMYYVAASGQPGQEQRMEGMWRSLDVKEPLRTTRTVAVTTLTASTGSFTKLLLLCQRLIPIWPNTHNQNNG